MTALCIRHLPLAGQWQGTAFAQKWQMANDGRMQRLCHFVEAKWQMVQ